ncbi:hypothetical protein BDV93DRAFT_520396 [Ceratobasidium sp. AG-I]|nr:hypothetical protein BDV93DRAFT_520396 [Ceratobasidium sp. AG-I]
MYRNTSQRRTTTHQEAIVVSCRFVATDQWFRTHIDPAWSVFELKRHLLARCVGAVPLAPSTATHGPRLLIPSQLGQLTLASLVRPPHASAIKSGTRPSTAPHATGEDGSKRKPRLSLKVVPGLSKPPPRSVNVHPPTPGLGLGASVYGYTGPPPPPPSYFSPRNPLSSPELSPPRFAPAPAPALDGPSPPSSPLHPRHSPTFSTGPSPSSPPSRPFSPTSLPGPVEARPLFTPEHPMMYMDASLRAPLPPLVRAMSTPPSPYMTTTPIRPVPKSPSLSSSSRHELTSSSVPRADSPGSGSTRSPLMSAAEFLDLESEAGDDVVYDFVARSPSPLRAGGGVSFAGAGVVGSVGSGSGSGGSGVGVGGGREEGKAVAGEMRWEDEFRLVSFGLGCVLDEHVSVTELRFRPGELLEIQRTNSIIHLPRPTYTQPYFEAPVYVLKRTPSSSSANHSRPHTSHHHHHQHVPARPHQHHIQPIRDYIPPQPQPSSSSTKPTHTHPPRPTYTPPPPPPPLLPPPPPHIMHQPHFANLNLPMSPIDPTPTPSPNTRSRSGTVTARDVYDGATWDHNYVRDRGRGKERERTRDGEADQSWAELEMSGIDGIGGGDKRGSGSGRSESTTGGGVNTSMSISVGGSGAGEKLEWKLRWLVMREGSIMILRSRRGPQLYSRPLTALLSAQQLPASPVYGTLPRHYISMHFTGQSKRDREKEDGVGLRMVDGAAHAHLQRVLLRIINTPRAHALLSTDTPYLHRAPPASQYPEWREHVVQRAWLAGRGTSMMRGGGMAIGPWMSAPWVAWTEREGDVLSDGGDTGSQYTYEGSETDASSTTFSGEDGEEGLGEYGYGYEDEEDEDRRDMDSEVEWDVEGWRAWESENAYETWNGGGGGAGGLWLRNKAESLGAGRPRSRSLAAPSSSVQQLPLTPTQQQTYPYQSTYPYPNPHPQYNPDLLLSPVSTSSELSSASGRRARSSTIAGPPQPDSPASSSTSPITWSPTSTNVRRPITASGPGIETILGAPDSISNPHATPTRRASAQARSTQPRSETERRGSANSLEMQRAVPSSRRAVTSPATGQPGARIP